ncbi:TPA: restriction endonuclease subunit S, partial [Haemophilus influenzae]
QDDLKKLYFPISPLDEQQKIAQFLDDKTAKIDRAVELAEKQIALLKEHKQILIQNAVTRGLNPDVPLKDSGVEWIGQVPEHWELTIGMNVFRENKRDNKGMKENTVLSLSYGKIIIKPEEKLFGLVPESFETYQIVEPNDIIIRCTDLQNDQTSLRTGLAQDKGIITSAYLNLKVINNYSAKFLHYYLHALDITKVLYKFGSGLRQNLSFLDFKRLPIIDISLAEQQQIADYLDKQTSKIDQAIALKTAHIEKLKEYKSVLINDVVTGKVRV